MKNYPLFLAFVILISSIALIFPNGSLAISSSEVTAFSIITGAGPGGSPHIRSFSQAGVAENEPNKLFAYGKSFRGGVHVATGDIDKDGTDEIITAPRAGGGPQVRIFEKNGTKRGIEIWPFHPSSRTGISVASGDADGDGKDEIAVAQAEKGQAWVKVYRYNQQKTILGEWNAFGDANCGASISMGDIDGDLKAEVAVGAGEGGGPQVRIFKADGTFIKQFFAFENSYRGGIDVDLGDFDGNGLKDEIVVSKKERSSDIKIIKLNSNFTVLKSFKAFNSNFRIGAFVDAVDFTGDSKDEILVGAGVGGGPQVLAFNSQGHAISSNFFAYDTKFRGGIDVSGWFLREAPETPAVFVGAGDIASCDVAEDEATAKLMDRISGTVFTIGDNVYPNGTVSEFANCYNPTWGRHKSRTKPVAGNHDYNTANASGYYSYFGNSAGDPSKGYYSYNLGQWHIIALNSNCSNIGGCNAGSSQEQWLRSDLAANSNKCTLAYMHYPLFSSGPHGGNETMRDLWKALYQGKAEIVLNGHDHDYERFAPQDYLGNANSTNGIREFVVGTGGKNLYGFSGTAANSEVRNNTTHGVLKLELYEDHYKWFFVPIAGKTFTDSGMGECH